MWRLPQRWLDLMLDHSDGAKPQWNQIAADNVSGRRGSDPSWPRAPDSFCGCADSWSGAWRRGADGSVGGLQGMSDDDGSAGRITGDPPQAEKKKMTRHRQSYNKPLVQCPDRFGQRYAAVTRRRGKEVPGKGNWPKIARTVHHNPRARPRKSLSAHQRVISVLIAFFDMCPPPTTPTPPTPLRYHLRMKVFKNHQVLIFHQLRMRTDALDYGTKTRRKKRKKKVPFSWFHVFMDVLMFCLPAGHWSRCLPSIRCVLPEDTYLDCEPLCMQQQRRTSFHA